MQKSLKTKLLLLAWLLLAASCQNQGGRRMFDEAMVMWQEGRHEEAVQNFIALTKAYPENDLVDDSMFWIANLYEHYLKDKEQAIRYYRSLTRDENSEYMLPALKGLARVYESQGGDARKKAQLIYQKLQTLPLAPEEFTKNQLRLAELYLEFREFEKCRAELKKLLSANPNTKLTPRAYHLIGLGYYIEGQREMAEVAFLEVDKKFQYSRPTLDSAMSLAQLYEERDQLDQAIIVYESILNRLDGREVFYQLANDRIRKLRSRQRQTSKG